MANNVSGILEAHLSSQQFQNQLAAFPSLHFGYSFVM